MLLFIVHLKILKNLEKRVSIHLMLLFILTFCLAEIFGPCFNTSHVVIYLIINLQQNQSGLSFNTSHVVIYQETIKSIQEKIPWFQYISCCYLSFLLLLPPFLFRQFQYISCCYLSFFWFSGERTS